MVVGRNRASGAAQLMLIIELKINERQIGLALAKNVTPHSGSADNTYEVTAKSEPNPYGSPDRHTHNIEITEHDRSRSPWALVARIATELAEREHGTY